jgi:hypothetical protein
VGPTAPQAPPALPRRYAHPPSPDGLRPDPATVAIVRDQVRALLMASPAFREVAPAHRRRLAHSLVKVAAYAAECVRDDWYQSERRLGQRPLVLRTERAPVAQALADQRPGADFVPGAAQKIAQVTKQTLDAIAFPTFVAELIRGTFDAITQSSIKQMEAFGRLLGDVGRTVDDFMNQNISDNQARDWLAQSYPAYLRVELSGGGAPAAPQRAGGRQPRAGRGRASAGRAGGGRAGGGAGAAGGGPEAHLVVVEGAEDRPLPNWRADLGVSGKSSLDESWLEEKLVPAARRKLAQNRLQTLSTMVLMGMERITVTGGKLRATMAFHIDTSDFAREERATDLDFRTAASGSFGYGPWSASASVSFAYVSSTRNLSESEMNVAADLTSEVEIHFKSAPFPLERMAGPAALGQIVSHTAVPEANTPIAASGDPIPWGAPVERAVVPARSRAGAQLRPGGELPTAPAPAAPAAQPPRPEPPPAEEPKPPAEEPKPPAEEPKPPAAEEPKPPAAEEPKPPAAEEPKPPAAEEPKPAAPKQPPASGGGEVEA